MQNSESGKRILYLIRHCHTSGGKRCISAADVPLDEYGEHQADNLRRWASDKNLTAVYSSPLSRALDTARAFGLPVTICGELREVDVGAWEGLEFDEIKSRFPEDFKKRGDNPGTYPPTNGESIEQAGKRLLRCLDEIIKDSQGSVAVISHGGANRGALCKLLGKSSDEALKLQQPWGGISEIEITPGGQMTVKSIGVMPGRFPGEREVLWLRDRYCMPEHVRKHCDAVAKKAVQLAEMTGLPVDKNLLYSASMLHDISRTRGHGHAAHGAGLMLESGYPDVAEIIAYHHDLPENASIEAQILYLADKLMQGDREVTLHERFLKSKKKCNSIEALEAWQRRYDTAVNIAKKLGLERDSADKIGAVVLAAGLSSRMHDFKPMLPLGDITIISRVINTLRNAGAEPVVVVTGYRADELEDHLEGENVIIVRNEDFASTQMFDSLLIGLSHIPADCKSILITPGDIPLVRLETIKLLISNSSQFVRPVCNGKSGHPVIMKRELIAEIMSYSGSGGLKGAVTEADIKVTDIETGDRGVLLDADTPEDYALLCRYFEEHLE